jgi:hypothetical protein
MRKGDVRHVASGVENLIAGFRQRGGIGLFHEGMDTSRKIEDGT